MYVNNESTPRYTSTQTFKAGDPANSTLRFVDYVGGAFTFSLTSAIPSTDILITNASVQGYTGTCVDKCDSDSLLGTATIVAGTTSVSKVGYSNLSGCNSYKRGNSIYVNGTRLSHGGTIPIGGTTVTVEIDYSTCQSYP